MEGFTEYKVPVRKQADGTKLKNIMDCVVPRVKLILTHPNGPQEGDKPRITGSRDSVILFRKYWEPYTFDHSERMYMMMLNRNNCVIAIIEISHGGQSGTVCDPKAVFQACNSANAAGFILAHNSP